MNGKDICLGLKYVSEDFIQEAETDRFPAQANQEKTYTKIRRPLLIAALITLMLLLVGCAVAYVLSIQSLKLGQQEVSRPVISEDGNRILSYENVNEQILTLNGLKGSPGYQAALEWYQFRKEYDLQETGTSEVPAEYSAYQLYSQETREKLDSILTKYSLKPVGEELHFRTVKNMCVALGIEKVQEAKNAVDTKVDSGVCWENGNFCLRLRLVLPEMADDEIHDTWGILRWNRKDCFSEDLITIEDTGDWQEWNHTTPSGSKVLIIRSPSDCRGWILCDRGEAMMSLQLESRRDVGYNEGGKAHLEYFCLTEQ